MLFALRESEDYDLLMQIKEGQRLILHHRSWQMLICHNKNPG